MLNIAATIVIAAAIAACAGGYLTLPSSPVQARADAAAGWICSADYVAHQKAAGEPVGIECASVE